MGIPGGIGVWHWVPLRISQHQFRELIDVIGQQAIGWTDADYEWRHQPTMS